MKLYLISQNKNNKYDTYDSAVVLAESEEADAKKIPVGSSDRYGTWTLPEFVTVKYLGEAIDGLEGDEGYNKNIICASFNAG